MQIVRVFPHQNNFLPIDEYALYGFQPLLLPLIYDEIHISCTFTWDKPYCRELKTLYESVQDKPVKLGGVAFGSPIDGFIQGMYLRSNIIFTSRGCNNRCPWCIVPKQEGKLKLLDHIPIGNIIQDNNFLQTNREHKEKVFEMLKTQKAIEFKGGLETSLIDDHFIDGIRDLRIARLWLACDTDNEIKALQKAAEKLKKSGFNRNKISCYVLSYGKNRDKDEARAKAVFEAGAMPFVQLYRDFSETKTEYSKDWEQWARSWQRPAIIKAKMKGEKEDEAD